MGACVSRLTGSPTQLGHLLQMDFARNEASFAQEVCVSEKLTLRREVLRKWRVCVSYNREACQFHPLEDSK